MTFQELGINSNILKSITALGFNTPTAIQEKSIPVLLQGDTDYIGLAQTGTGKTAAFGLPLIHGIDINNKTIQALVLCPTRELCLQISKELQNYSKFVDGFRVVSVYGGADITKQIRDIRKGAHIVVGTPGRLIDHIQRGTISLRVIQTVVLDEADEMLNMGFQEDINTILAETPKEKNVWLFSATMPNRVERIAADYMENPFKVTVGSKNSSAKNIDHQYCVVKRTDKYNALKRIIDVNPQLFGILFCRTRRDAKDIALKLMNDGYAADAIHGDLSQFQRDAVMKKFRNKQIQVLVATDVAARGIDVSDVTHVMHYALPEDIENYTHRSGRTARAGKSGISLAILSPREASDIPRFVKQINKEIKLVKVPNGNEIAEKQLLHLIDSLDNVSVNQDRIAPYLETVFKKFENTSKEDLIAKFISAEFDQILHRYENASDLNTDGKKGARSRSVSRNGSGSRLFINLGGKDGFNKGSFIKFICDTASITSKVIGKIFLQDTFTIFYIEDAQAADRLMTTLNNQRINGRRVSIEYSEDRGPRERGSRSRNSRDRGPRRRQSRRR